MFSTGEMWRELILVQNLFEPNESKVSFVTEMDEVKNTEDPGWDLRTIVTSVNDHTNPTKMF